MTEDERLAKKEELATKVYDITSLHPGTTKPSFKPVKHIPTKGIKAKVIKGREK